MLGIQQEVIVKKVLKKYIVTEKLYLLLEMMII